MAEEKGGLLRSLALFTCRGHRGDTVGTPWLEPLLTFDYVFPGEASLGLRSEKQTNRVGDVAVGLGDYIHDMMSGEKQVRKFNECG